MDLEDGSGEGQKLRRCTCLKVLDLASGLQPTQARRFLGLKIKSDHFTSNALPFQSTPELLKKEKKRRKKRKEIRQHSRSLRYIDLFQAPKVSDVHL